MSVGTVEPTPITNVRSGARCMWRVGAQTVSAGLLAPSHCQTMRRAVGDPTAPTTEVVSTPSRAVLGALRPRVRSSHDPTHGRPHPLRQPAPPGPRRNKRGRKRGGRFPVPFSLSTGSLSLCPVALCTRTHIPGCIARATDLGPGRRSGHACALSHVVAKRAGEEHAGDRAGTGLDRRAKGHRIGHVALDRGLDHHGPQLGSRGGEQRRRHVRG